MTAAADLPGQIIVNVRPWRHGRLSVALPCCLAAGNCRYCFTLLDLAAYRRSRQRERAVKIRCPACKRVYIVLAVTSTTATLAQAGDPCQTPNG